MCNHIQAEAALLTATDQLHRYVITRAPLVPLAKTASLTFDLLHGYSSYQTTIISSTHFQHQLATALRGEDTTDSGEEAKVLGSLAAALQVTTEMLSASDTEKEEREGREIAWRTGVLRELMVSVMTDATWSV